MTQTAAAPTPLVLTLATPAATDRLGRFIAPHLNAGDCLLLSGPIGAGKTHFARALIRSRLGAEGAHEDVPSPSYTLVQVYAAEDCDIWHCDLYRLGDSSELIELGLEQAFDTALCVIEWPERLGDLAPPRALRMDFGYSPADDGRRVTLRATGVWDSLWGGLARWEAANA